MPPDSPEHGERQHRHHHDRKKAPPTPEEAPQSGTVPLAALTAAADAAVKRIAEGVKMVLATPPPGSTLMVEKPLHIKFEGDPKHKDHHLAHGTVVEVVQAESSTQVRAKVYSSHGGKQAILPLDHLRAEPALGHKTDEPGHTTEPHDYTYAESTSVLWNGAPHAGDVGQGGLGDCYLMAAMGAVAAANPKAIMDLISPHTPNLKSYQVSLYLVPPGGGRATLHSTTVDTELPSVGGFPVYGQMGHDFTRHKNALWPALIEKAYAQLSPSKHGKSGYASIGDEGGAVSDAFLALTGSRGSDEQIAGTPAAVLAQFRGFKRAGKAVCCGSLNHKSTAHQGGFKGTGDGPYRAHFKNDHEEPEIVAGTLQIRDQKGKADPVHDQEGKLVGNEAGTHGKVNYGKGSVELHFAKNKSPDDHDDLEATYDWRGVLDHHIKVMAHHSYMALRGIEWVGDQAGRHRSGIWEPV